MQIVAKAYAVEAVDSIDVFGTNINFRIKEVKAYYDLPTIGGPRKNQIFIRITDMDYWINRMAQVFQVLRGYATEMLTATVVNQAMTLLNNNRVSASRKPVDQLFPTNHYVFDNTFLDMKFANYDFTYTLYWRMIGIFRWLDSFKTKLEEKQAIIEAVRAQYNALP